ncbi:hypothetical protein GOP47_0030068 [Adiantum capillus-veneris]|nr:hypothetical protein GOP47_0030610 [Adiantum capillus-veneris]KAI5054923.1 hypothetical protein GOP47_0030068 [Adiantum capillus-veneris]
MQGLRHASRHALRASAVIREPCMASARAWSTEAAPTVRLSKKERYDLAFGYVEKYKASNDGHLPPMTLLRKEVGGSYDTLKEVMQEFAKHSNDKVATEKTVDLKKSKRQKPAGTKEELQAVEVATQNSSAVAKDERKKKSSSKERNESTEQAATMLDQDDKEDAKKALSRRGQHDKEDVAKESAGKTKDGQKKQSLSLKEKESGQDRKSTLQGLKSLEEMQSVKQPDAKLTADGMKKQKRSSMLTADTLESLMDTLTTDEDNDDDDSDVAAPEYQQSLTTQIKEDLPQARASNLKVGSVVHSKDDQAIRSGLPLKDKNAKIKEMQKGLGAVNTVLQSMAQQPSHSRQAHPIPMQAQQPSPDWSSAPANRPPTTVLRIVNLPTHTSAQQLRSVCESVAKVHGVNLRRGRIADVHFDVDLREMNNVLDRLRKVTIGVTTLKVFPALRFSCESGTSSRFKPRDIQQFKYVRNGLINAFEQRFKFLCFQVQDFRELHNLKVEK